MKTRAPAMSKEAMREESGRLVKEAIARKVPIYKRAVFWGVLGGVLAAGAIVGGVVAATLPGKIGPNTPATLTIQPN